MVNAVWVGSCLTGHDGVFYLGPSPCTSVAYMPWLLLDLVLLSAAGEVGEVRDLARRGRFSVLARVPGADHQGCGPSDEL